MNSKGSNNIYDLSKNIEEQQQKRFAAQAKSIANAYRKVQQLKVDSTQRKQQPKKSKQQSTYTQKIKDTLKQINANKTKQIESLRRMAVLTPAPQSKKEICKLMKVGSTKMFNTLDYYHLKLIEYSYKRLKEYSRQQEAKQNYFIENYRIYQCFKAWKRVTAIQNMQKKKDQEQLGLKSEQIAKEFHSFVLLRKSFKSWQAEINKQKKRKRYEQQLTRKQIQQQNIKQSPSNQSKKIVENAQLQNKVRGFLQNLKEKIEKKDRLITIKQNTEQSDIHVIKHQTQQVRQEQYEEAFQNDQQEESRSIPHHPQQIVIQPPLPQVQKKAMSNDDLQKKRKQLQIKHKSRKDALQKLKKEKEEKKKEQQRERQQVQKQVEAQQKRIKQEKYRQYLKNKQEQQQWQRREIQLNQTAQKFNTYRLLKYYGLRPLLSVKNTKITNITTFYQTILLILYRLKSQQFMRNLQICSQNQLQTKLQKMNKRYTLNLLRKHFRAFRDNKQRQVIAKLDYKIMHEVNTLKIYLSAWKKVYPLLCNQNYEWQRPRMKRAHQFYKLQLCLKSLRSLRRNKEIQQKERCIAEQKDKIKNKIKSMLQEQDSFDYNSYL